VTLIDANHCPGSVLFVFDIQHSDAIWTRHLHTGDFRANPEMCLHPLLRQPDNPTIDTLYLDTTYLNAKYGFPAQEECIQAACRAVESHIGIQDDARPKTALDRWIGQSAPPKTSQPSAFDALMTGSKVANRSKGLLVVVGTYSIGKEKVFCGKSTENSMLYSYAYADSFFLSIALAKLLGSKIFVTQAKRSILRCQENKELENLLTLDQNEAQVHVVPLNHIKPEVSRMHFD
jgi:DNA cross-link repair 1A protein